MLFSVFLLWYYIRVCGFMNLNKGRTVNCVGLYSFYAIQFIPFLFFSLSSLIAFVPSRFTCPDLWSVFLNSDLVSLLISLYINLEFFDPWDVAMSKFVYLLFSMCTCQMISQKLLKILIVLSNLLMELWQDEQIAGAWWYF